MTDKKEQDKRPALTPADVDRFVVPSSVIKVHKKPESPKRGK